MIVNESEATSLISKEQQAKEERIKRGIKEILEFRGFSIKKPDDNDDYIDVYAEKKQEEGDKITAIARFPKNPQIGVKTIRTLGKLQEEESLDEALLIAESALTHYAKKESVKLGIEIISSTNPLFNIFDHELVPQHIKLKNKEIKSFLTRYQIEKYQIPKILETDPAVKAIQAKPGDIIKIVRNPEMGEDGAYYRVIIKSSARLRLSDDKPATKKKTTVKKTAAKPKEAAKKTAAKPKEAAKKTAAKPKETAKKATTKPKEAAKKATTKPKEAAKKA
ncbi:MAG: DNA-directed RNA polymerase subunit H, partial [Candidatus Heimdallarchaeota archaeon]|nr:DNA-directed RNA polymerase subunit H [Candidatus Heimdallarchaeota archaeon]